MSDINRQNMNENRNRMIYGSKLCFIKLQKKREGMIQEIEETHNHDHNKPTTEMYSFKDICIQDEKSILIYFLRHLTFDSLDLTLWQDFTNEQTVKLKQLIDNIYTAYKCKKRNKRQLQGLWSLLSFSFNHRNGLSLYLYFQKIYQAEPETMERVASSQVKEEFIQFEPRQYFRKNNQWIKDKNFIQALTVLEIYSQGLDVESLSKFCYNLYQSILTEVDYLCISRQFQQRYSVFKTKILRQSKKGKIYTLMFKDRFCNENVVFSEPDVINTFQYFTQQQFLLNQSYSKPNIIIDVKGKCKTVIQQISEQQEYIDESIIIQREQSNPTSTISIPKKNQLTSYSKSSITKKKSILERKKSVKGRQKLIKRMPRHKFIQKMYQLQDQKNICLQEIKNERKKQSFIKKKKKKLQRMHEINYQSDEQQIMSRSRRNKKQRPRRMEIQSADQQSKYSMPNQSVDRRNQHNEEQKNINKKMKNKRKLQKIHHNNSQIGQNQFIVPDDSFYQHRVEQEQQNIQSSFVQKIEILNLKEDHSLQYIKTLNQVIFDRKPRQQISNMEIRKLNLDQAQNMALRFDLQSYLVYLARLQNGKQIRREVINVSKQFMTFQNKVLDIDMTVKIMALLIVSENRINSTFTIWTAYKDTYIVPMLKYCIYINVYYVLSEIVNNLFVSFCNEDLSIIAKCKYFFSIILNISRKFNFEPKFVDLIYQALPTNKAKQIKWSQRSNIVLQDPLIIGSKNIKNSLSQTDTQIALIIATFVFDNLVLCPLIKNEIYKQKQQQYIQYLIKDITDAQNKGSWIYCFIDYLKRFNQIYKPSINELYFKKIVILIGISTNQLSIDLINNENLYSQEINTHVQFLKYIFKEYINSQLIKNGSVNCLQLLNKLIVSNEFRNRYQGQKDNLSIIIYSNILALIMTFPPFKHNISIQNNLFKYPNQKLSIKLDQIISRLHLKVNSSIFNIVYAIYQAKISQKIKEENDNFSMILTPTQNLTELLKKYQDIRKIIQQIYAKIDKKYDQIQIRLQKCDEYHRTLNKNKYSPGQYKKKLDDMDQITSGLMKCQESMVLFLNIFIFDPQQSHSHYEGFNFQISISHFFFVLQFIVSQNFFMKYFMNKFKTSNSANLNQKYSEIIRYWLEKVPNCMNFLANKTSEENADIFTQQWRHLKNRQLSKWFFRILSSANSNMKFDLYEALTRLENKQYLQPLSLIYGIHLIGNSQINQKRTLNQQNNLLKYLQQSTNPNSISVQKIQKSILILNYIFSQISKYICNQKIYDKSQNSTNFNQSILEVKKYLSKKILIQLAKEIVIIIVVGFCLKNLTEYQYLPLQELIVNLKSLKLIQSNMGEKKNAYIYFILAMENAKRQISITDIFDELSGLFQDLREIKQFSSSISKILIELQIILRRLQDKSKQKWFITLQSVKILTFIIRKQPELQIECIKKYLNDMQIISNGGNLICKIKINQNNMFWLILFFHQIDKLTVNPYHIKNTKDIYIDQMCARKISSKQSQDQNLKQMVNIFISLRECIRHNTNVRQIVSPFLQELINKFCQPLLCMQESISLSSRLDIYLQMMENSDYERKIYQNYFITNKERFNRIINLTKDKQKSHLLREIVTFQNAILKCTIGQHSDFFSLHKLINQCLENNSDVDIMIKIFEKFIRYLEKTNGNYWFIIQAKQKIQKIKREKYKSENANANKQNKEDYSEWMDIQQ